MEAWYGNGNGCDVLLLNMHLDNAWSNIRSTGIQYM
jgi:hypothetical protein